MQGKITADQYDVLRRSLNGNRVASRSQGGKSLSYLESWDVRAHLIRVFGYGGFDLEMIDHAYMGARDYMSEPRGNQPAKAMVEVIYSAKMRLVVRDPEGLEIARYCEAAVGSASGPANMLGEHHDNALKTAASDALKRCAINLGTQFGLSLYDNGSRTDVVRWTKVVPEGAQAEEAATPEQQAALEASVGATSEPTAEASPDPEPTPEPTDKVTEAEMGLRRRQMFALFNDAGFDGGDAGRVERLGYCQAVVDHSIESSNDLTHDELMRVIAALQQVINDEKAKVKA